MTLGNGWIENHEYDGTANPATRIQPTRILVTKPDLTTVLDLRYCYTCGSANDGNNGNVWTHTIQNLGVTQSFGYDVFNRLTSAVETSGGFGQSYVYDAFGNRAVTQNSTQLDTPRTPLQNSDSTLPFNSNNQWTLATYDPNGTGNQTGVASDTFQYDAENRVRQSTQGSVTATYDYDGEGRRVRKISGSSTIVYVYDAMGEVAAEYGGTPAPVSGTSYVAVDTLGSSRAEVDSLGNVTRHDYLPFGQEIPNSWGLRTYNNDYARADGFTRKFTGKERDSETGLDYLEARYMSSAQGRFTSPDEPLADQNESNPQSWNLYSYVRNNPLRYTDPTGRCSQADGGYTDQGNGLFPGACSGGAIGEQKAGNNSVTAGVGREQAVYIMLQGIYDMFTSAHEWGTVVNGAGQGAATVLAPGATAVAQCATASATGGTCDKTDLAMAFIPGGPAGRVAARATRWGWAGTKKFRAVLRQLRQPGTHEALEGIVPTLEEAKDLIRQSGGTIDRIEPGHLVGGRSAHTYPHINYTTEGGSKATVRIESVGK